MPTVEYLIKDVQYGGVPDDQLTQKLNRNSAKQGGSLSPGSHGKTSSGVS